MHFSIPDGVHAHLRSLTAEHSLFKQQGNTHFGAKLLHKNPSQAARLLINKAVQVGAASAVDWLTRVYTIKSAGIRYVTEAFGILMEAPYRLSNGVSFCAFRDIPPSKRAQLFNAHLRTEAPWFFSGPVTPIAAVYEVAEMAASAKTPSSPRADPIEEAIRAHAIVDDLAAPYSGESWVEFIDPELEDANVPLMSSSFSPYDGPSARGFGYTLKMSPDSVSKVEAILELPPKLLSKVDVAASRLIMARNRISPANKAIDGCICLESLLGDSQPGELSYKLSLRSALLTATDLADGLAIRRQVADFYTLRSKAVHGAHKTKPADSETAAQGLKICSRVLRKIVELKTIPTWAEYELQDRKYDQAETASRD